MELLVYVILKSRIKAKKQLFTGIILRCHTLANNVLILILELRGFTSSVLEIPGTELKFKEVSSSSEDSKNEQEVTL